MGNSKSTLANEQAILEAAIQEFTANSNRAFEPEEVDEDIQDAMLAVMDGNENEEVLEKITRYQERRRSSCSTRNNNHGLRSSSGSNGVTSSTRSSLCASDISNKTFPLDNILVPNRPVGSRRSSA